MLSALREAQTNLSFLFLISGAVEKKINYAIYYQRQNQRKKSITSKILSKHKFDYNRNVDVFKKIEGNSFIESKFKLRSYEISK